MSKKEDPKKPAKGRKPTPVVGGSSAGGLGTSLGATSKRIKKNIEEYFGEIVPTSDAGRQLAKDKKKTIDDYFGSEVDHDAASDQAILQQTQELLDNIPLPPRYR